jgi:hypothetical protein
MRVRISVEIKKKQRSVSIKAYIVILRVYQSRRVGIEYTTEIWYLLGY